jgi:tRNA(fMet)-specific endonuclease VapC
MRYLWDAVGVIDHMTGQAGIRALYPTLAHEGTALSIVTYIELYEGVYRTSNGRQALRSLRAFLRRTSMPPISRHVAEQTARLRADLRARNRPIQHRAYDLIVAATALTHNLTILTSNTRDYSDIPGLRMLNVRANDR